MMEDKTTEIRLTEALSPRYLLLLYLFIIIGATGYGMSTSGGDFGAYNPEWDGTSSLRTYGTSANTTLTIATNTSQYPMDDASNATVLILSPSTGYTPDERQNITQFVKRGGTVVIADDFGPHTNPLLRAIGATARFNRTELHDTRRYYQSSAFPNVQTSGNHSLTDDVDTVVFNHGTTVKQGNATVLLESSNFSYLDITGNDQLDDSEHLEQRPVGTVEPVGNGSVIAISDPSIFLNAMLEQGDNRELAGNLVRMRSEFVLDYSHTSTLPPLVRLQLAVHRSVVLLIATGGLFVAGLYLAQQLLPEGSHRSRGDSDSDVSRGNLPISAAAIVTYVENRYPEMSAAKFRRVTKEVINDKNNKYNDE